MTSAIIINPLSAKSGRRGQALERAAAGVPGLLLERLDDFGKLPNILKNFAKEKVELIIVSGGDGTVQAVVTALAENKNFKTSPKLMLLAHGTTNMTAADIGFNQPTPERVLQTVTRSGFIRRATNVKSRASVRVGGLAAMPAQHCFFFGCGAVTRAVIKCQTDVHAWGLKGDWATGATLALGLVKTLLGRDQDDPERMFQPTDMRIGADGKPLGGRQNLLFLVTTLNKLILGCRPFWNTHGGPLHATTIGYPAGAILRSTFKVMYGGENRTLDPTKFSSRGATGIKLEIDAPVVLDGEILQPSSEGIDIQAGPVLDFICGN